MAGPKGSAVIPATVRRWLPVGDETAPPAIGRRIEEAAAGEQVTRVVAVDGPGQRQSFNTPADLTALWAYRPLARAADPPPLLSAVRALALLPVTFVLIAAEAAVARPVRQHMAKERDHPRGWIKANGYRPAGPMPMSG